MLLINLVTSVLWNLGSGCTGLFSAAFLLDIYHPAQESGFRFLSAVLAPALFAIVHTAGVKRAADNMVTHTGQILNTPAANQHYRMLLQIVPLTGDIRGYLVAVGQPHTGHLTQSRVRLLGRCGVNPGADPPPLRATGQCRSIVLALNFFFLPLRTS